MDAKPSDATLYDEFGTTGLSVMGGQVREEFVPELRGLRGIRIFREMRDNDPIISAMFFAFEALLLAPTMTVEPGGDVPEDLASAQFIGSLFSDMSTDWSSVMSEILTMLPFGWAYLEIVWKRRLGANARPGLASRYDDGLIGIRKLALRGQESLDRWSLDDEGGVQAMIQRPTNIGVSIAIPIEKSLLFRTRMEKNNPQGRSLLRGSWRPWFFKKGIERIEAIGVERDLAGLPTLTPPAGFDIWNTSDPTAVTAKAAAEKLIRGVRRDEQEGVLLPYGWTFALTSTGGSRQFDTNAIINRYSTHILLTLLADVILLGQQGVGSLALGETKADLLMRALEHLLQGIAGVINRYLIPRAMSYNGLSGAHPYVKFGKISEISLKELGTFVKDIAGVGALTLPDDALEDVLRHRAGLPGAGTAEIEPEALTKRDWTL